MSFKTYAQIIQPDGLWHLSDPQPLVFSGAHGLIAKFVNQEKNRVAEPWKLCPGEIHALALPGALVRDRVIMFEQSQGDTLELLWLRDIRGISAAKTEMMFSFTPMRVAQSRPVLQVHAPLGERIYGEDLTLDGGVLNPQGTWHWHKPHLHLGGVRLGPVAGVPVR